MRQPDGSSALLQVEDPSTRVAIAPGSNDTAHAGQWRWQALAVISVVMSLTVYLFSRTVADPDLWGHIKFGETAWKAGSVAVPDPFSYLTSGRLWLNHEWLSEVIFYLVFDAIGSAGLIAMKVVLSLVVMSTLYWHLCRQGINALRAAFLVVVVLYFFLISLVTVRTLIFSYPLFLIMLVLIHQLSTALPRWRWIVPPLFVLWANLHPGFLAGLGILGIWATVEILARHLSDDRSVVAARPATREIVLLVIAGGLATLLNPYGLTLWGFLRETAFGARPDISEWQPLVLMTSYGLSYAAFVALALWGIVYSRRQRRASLMVVLTVTALLPLVAIRHTPLAALAITALAGEHIADAWDRWASARQAPGPLRDLSPAWFAAAALGAALLLSASALPRFFCIRITPEIGGSYPARAVGLIKQSGVVGNLAIDFDWGEYALYHLSPAVKVSVDGRRETAYSRSIYIENLTFMFGRGNWDALLQRPETHLALVKTGFPTFNLMKLEPGWRLIYQDSLASVFGREGLPIVETLRRTAPPALPPDGAGLCFP
jgi:hypothetical protein